MGVGAFSSSIENLLSAVGSPFVETPLRLRRGNRQLIIVKRGQLGRNQVRIVSDVSKACSRRNGELRCVIQSRITAKGSRALNLGKEDYHSLYGVLSKGETF